MIARITRRELLAGLRQSGRLSEQAEAEALRLLETPLDPVELPWFVRLLQGLGAWVSTFLVLFAILLTFGQKMGLVGLPLCWAGLVLERKVSDSPYVSQLSISFVLLGAALSVFGLGSLTEGLMTHAARAHEQFWFVFNLMVCGVVNRLTTGKLTRSAMTFSMLVSVFMLVSLSLSDRAVPQVLSVFLVLYASATVALVLYEAKARTRLGARFEPLLSSLVAVLVLGLSGEVALRNTDNAHLFHVLILSVSLTMLMAWTLSAVLSDIGQGIKERQRLKIMLLGVLVALALYQAPGAIFALILLLLAWRIGSKVLVGVAVISLLVSLSHFYYLLQVSLLLKSLALVASGGLMLMAGRNMTKSSVL